MLDFFLIIIGMGISMAGGGNGPGTSTGSVQVAESGLLSGTEESAPTTPATGETQYVAEPQVPTGKFTTATEIKPIMGATKANWVAVREYDGRDLIYFTHLLSWRCGLVGVRYSINGAPMQDWPLPPCLIDTAAPNAVPQDAQIYETHPLGSIQSVEVEIIYDDLTRDNIAVQRKDVLMP